MGKVTSFHSVSTGPSGEGKMIKYVKTQGPLSVAVDATAWQTYQEGVMSASTCAGVQLDHAVQAVAYNGNAAKPYWVVRNSWAADWGEEGYIRLTVGDNTCLVAD